VYNIWETTTRVYSPHAWSEIQAWTNPKKSEKFPIFPIIVFYIPYNVILYMVSKMSLT